MLLSNSPGRSPTSGGPARFTLEAVPPSAVETEMLASRSSIAWIMFLSPPEPPKCQICALALIFVSGFLSAASFWTILSTIDSASGIPLVNCNAALLRMDRTPRETFSASAFLRVATTFAFRVRDLKKSLDSPCASSVALPTALDDGPRGSGRFRPTRS